MADVVAKAAKPCDVDGKTYKDGEEFKPNCSLLCTCQNGVYACASLCPQEDRAPSRAHCRDAQLVAIVGQCCREWVCPHAHSIAQPDDDAGNPGKHSFITCVTSSNIYRSFQHLSRTFVSNKYSIRWHAIK